VKAEENPELWERLNENVKMLKVAYERLLMERFILGRELSVHKSRELEIASMLLNKLVWCDDTQRDKGIIRIVWRKDAVKKYQLKGKTIEFIQEYGYLVPKVKDTIQRWVDKLCKEPYSGRGYDFDVTVEDLPED
jgi:hypothetical protein